MSARDLGRTLEERLVLDELLNKPWFERVESDPDRFVNFGTAGSQEWWYFDAISSDGRDAIVIVWYASLPFDPEYGVQTLCHLRNPSKFPAPNPLDHCAIGIHWYRDGKTLAYALNGYKAEDFRHQTAPFTVEVDSNRLERDQTGYQLTVETPALDGQSVIKASFRFVPAASTVPFATDLGTPESRHEWTLVAGDCQVTGHIEINGPDANALNFEGRGYHDHNAGSEEIRLAMKTWGWGRVHVDTDTFVYYFSDAKAGTRSDLVLKLRDGEPQLGQDYIIHAPWRKPTIFGLLYPGQVALIPFDKNRREKPAVVVRMGKPVDAGPFYLRWVAEFTVNATHYLGITEWLETRNLHRPWFNWMIGYRLKRPKRTGDKRPKT